jgi:indolepyruvate ferredoxin oxidoreductase beta subunit
MPDKRKPAATESGNVLFCGIGGQGVLKASEICGVAAMLDGYHVKKSEVHGMAQRGGSVESHLRFGSRVFSPLIAPGGADLLVCFDRGEGERKAAYLKPQGVSFAPFIDLFEKEGGQLGGRRFLNTFFLGILSAYLPMQQESWLTALMQVFTRAQEQNRDVFLKGAQAGQDARAKEAVT